MALLQHKQRSVATQRTARGVPSRPVLARRALRVRAGTVEPGATVLVAGATGGVGQLVTAKLLERGYKVRALTRSRNSSVLKDYGPNCEVVTAGLRDAAAVPRLLEGVRAVVCATGTTAYPSKRWDGDNGPKQTDLVATGNLIEAAKAKKDQLARFLLVTSAGVERPSEFPWMILNAFGVLTYKRQSEQALQDSGVPYTILRPSRLMDGPYTSYDLNTLLNLVGSGTSGSRKAVKISLTDRLAGEASRICVAEAAVQALALPEAENKAFAIENVGGEGPGSDAKRWQGVFAGAQP